MAMQGSLKDMSVADIIQHNCQDRKTALLLVERKGTLAKIYFKDGAVVHAVMGSMVGEEVIFEALTWDEGVFTLDLGTAPTDVSIRRNWSSLLLEGAKRLDERTVEHLEEAAPGPSVKDQKNELIRRLLSEFLVRHPGYFGAAIAGIDSNIRIIVANGMMEETILGSISTAAQSFGKRSLGLLGFGKHHRSWILGEKGKYVVSAIDPYTLFIAVSTETDIEPDISPVIEKMCAKLTELV